MNPIQELAARILRLTPRELAELNRLLRDAGGPGLAGVREPLRPKPSSGDGAA